jgi:hypothetical protein
VWACWELEEGRRGSVGTELEEWERFEEKEERELGGMDDGGSDMNLRSEGESVTPFWARRSELRKVVEEGKSTKTGCGSASVTIAELPELPDHPPVAAEALCIVLFSPTLVAVPCPATPSEVAERHHSRWLMVQ